MKVAKAKCKSGQCPVRPCSGPSPLLNQKSKAKSSFSFRYYRESSSILYINISAMSSGIARGRLSEVRSFSLGGAVVGGRCDDRNSRI